MAKMYEVIMNLPLFKGVSIEQVSYFLEKTHINFMNVEQGDVIVSAGEDVKMIRFIISGEIIAIHKLPNFNITIEEKSGFGKVIGAERLYGMNTAYPCDIVAGSKVSMLEFSKEQYVNLLNSDNIYMLNFFNYLSLRAQRPVESLDNLKSYDIRSKISFLLALLTDSESREVVIKGRFEKLSLLLSVAKPDLLDWAKKSEEEELLTVGCDMLTIHSRNNFVG